MVQNPPNRPKFPAEKWHMAKNHITEDEFLRMVLKEIRKLGSQKAFAQKIGISQQYLSDILRKKRLVCSRMLDYFDMKMTVLIERRAIVDN